MITVCIPTYNGEKYIEEQLHSILRQLSSDDQVVISDDGSNDKTIEKIRAIADSRIEIYINRKQINRYRGIFDIIFKINRNMQNALKHAKGDYIFLADQDDIWLDNKVERIVEELKDADCIIHDCVVINDTKKVISESFFDNYIKPNPTIVGTFIQSPFMGCCMGFKSNVLKKSIPFPSFPIEHDTWIGLCALKIGKVKIINDKLINYRRHELNVSPCTIENKNSLWVKLKRRVYILWGYLFY